MAELLIKIRDGANYEDGDVLCAFNDRRILCCHASSICNVKNAPRDSSGLIRETAVARDWYEATHQFRFERISNTEVRRVNLLTGTRERFGADSIDVPLFVRRRRQNPMHRLFGTDGAEIWYGGRKDLSLSAIGKVWDAIEAKTPLRRTDADRVLWPMGRLDIRHHLAVRVQDFTDEELFGLESPQYELDANGDPVMVDVLDERGNPKEIDGERLQVPKVLAKRNIRVNWRTELLDDLGVTEEEVLDLETPIGRDVQLSDSQWRHESKPQPVQVNRAKLYSKAAGGPLANA